MLDQPSEFSNGRDTHSATVFAMTPIVPAMVSIYYAQSSGALLFSVLLLLSWAAIKPRYLIVFHLSAVSSAARYLVLHWPFSADDPRVHTLLSHLW
jgi:hypothetical protein